MFEAGGVTISIPGSIPFKKSRKVFDDVIMLYNIRNALNLAFKHTVVVTDELSLSSQKFHTYRW